MIDLSQLKAKFEVPIQWGDMDAFGHVNNTRHFLWFESARVEYLYQSGLGDGMRLKGWGPILASVRCDYRKQLHFPDTVIVASRIARIGRSSFTMEHHLFSQRQEQLAAMGESVIVMFDYESQRPLRIESPLRQQIEQFEGRSLSEASS